MIQILVVVSQTIVWKSILIEAASSDEMAKIIKDENQCWCKSHFGVLRGPENNINPAFKFHKPSEKK